MDWSAAQYGKFEDERTRPVRDLIAQIPNECVHSAVDLGCGPGNSTEVMCKRFASAVITGIDSSPDMLDAARTRLPALRFESGDIATWSQGSGTYDVIVANASLQWVPDHAALLPALLARLAPGGSLAVQIPDNLQEPTHRLILEVAAGGPWAAKLVNVGRANENRKSADWYYRALCDSASVNVWRTTYYHRLAGGARSVVEWFRSTALRPYLELLDPAELEAFLAQYEAALATAYPTLPDGAVLLPFPRLFFVATRAR